MVKLLHRRNAVWMFLCCLMMGVSARAQVLTEVVGKRLYEHHSPGAKSPSGGVSGEKSGYDFVTHTFISSFNPANFGKYTNGEELDIDMVEHNGPAARPLKSFGFTSGVSSIWNGDIRGNSITKWVAASSSFDYTSVSNVSALKAEYNAGTPDSSVESVTEGGIYIAKIRNTEMYVAMKCYNVTNGSMNSDIYFDFDYKYGTASSVSLKEENEEYHISVYPSPASNILNLVNDKPETINLTISSIEGRTLKTLKIYGKDSYQLDISDWDNGNYFIKFQVGNGVYTQRFIKH